jgi:HEAT repeat protein
MRALRAAALLALAACSSAKSDEEITLDLFDKVELSFVKLIDAYASQDPARVAREESDLHRLVAANYERVKSGLGSDDPPRRGAAAFALGFSRNPEAIALLLPLTEDRSGFLRARGIVALGMLAFKEVPTEPFKKLLDDPEWEVRLSAVHGLRYLLTEAEDRGLAPAVTAKLADPVMDVRNEALILLRKLRRKEVMEPLLTRTIRDLEPLVRANAALTLGALGAQAMAATPHLIEMLRDEDAKVVEAAWVALNRINEKDFDRSYATWRDWFEDEQRHYYACPDHKDVTRDNPGECPLCKKKLERIPRDGVKKSEPPPTVYVCPEHKEVQTAGPSKCGKCDKDLVPQKLDVVYACPDHPEVQTKSPAKCGRPGCGRDLVPKK